MVLGASAEGGTGWAVAEELARCGAKVMVGARTLERLETLAQRLDGVACACDAAHPEQIEVLSRAAADAFGTIDIAVNCAGLPVRGLIAEAGSEQLQQALDVNYLANVHFVKNMTAVMKDGGAITLVTSYSAVQPMLPHFAYACAKAATDCLVRYAALEFGPRGIRVNSVQPGPIKSPLVQATFARPGVEAAYAREIPLGRVGHPEDFASIIAWLSGPTFVTGLNIPVSGGNHLTRIPRADELPPP